jgi:hypothetical protein
MPTIDFVTGSYPASSKSISVRKTVNWFPESTEGQGKRPTALIPTPGTKTFTTNPLPDQLITSIQGVGTNPNGITVETSDPHNLILNQIVTIGGTTSYDETNVKVVSVNSATSFTYFSFISDSTTEELGGLVVTTGESPIPGVDPNAECRGLYTTSTGRLFTCFAGSVFEGFADGSTVERFTITDLTTRVSIVDDGVSLCLADGFQYVVMPLDNNIAEVIDTQNIAGFQNPAKLKFINQRIIIINNDTDLENNNKFFWSLPRQAKVIEPLGFAVAEGSADPIISMEIRNGDIWFFGPRSIEVWRTDINDDLPFRRIGGSNSQIGCGARYSTASIGDQVFWLGSSEAGKNVVYKSQGNKSLRVSNHALESLLDKTPEATQDAVGFTHQKAGHTFYTLNFTHLNMTWCLDLATGLWSERATRDAFTNVNRRWAVLFATFAFERVICGSNAGPLLFTLEADRKVEWDGRPIVRTHESPIYFDDMQLMFMDRLDIDMQTGVGLQANYGEFTNQIQGMRGTDPILMLEISNDSGNTFNTMRNIPIGKVGKYSQRASARRCGRGRDNVVRISISDPVDAYITGAKLTYTKGQNF